jgi:hypothetical protein
MGNWRRILLFALVLVGTALTVFPLSNSAEAATPSAFDTFMNGKVLVQSGNNLNLYSSTITPQPGLASVVQNGTTYYFVGHAGTVQPSENSAFSNQAALSGAAVPASLREMALQYSTVNPNGVVTGNANLYSSGGWSVGMRTVLGVPIPHVGGAVSHTPVTIGGGAGGGGTSSGATVVSGAGLSHLSPSALAKDMVKSAMSSSGSTDLEFGCDVFGGMAGVMRCIAGLLYYVIVVPVQFVFSIIANLFDWVLKTTILKATYENPQIRIGWLAIRDVINITFIFALLWHALGLIVGAPGRDNKHLVNIIIAAVFINFSWFIVSQLINLSNTASMALYNTIGGGGESIASGFASALGFGSLVANEGIIRLIQANPGNGILLMLAGAVLMVILGVILLFSVALFVGRYVVLTILAILSPLMFLGFIFPSYQDGIKKDFWGSLRGQLIFPVAYFAMLWISFNVIHAAGNEIKNADWAKLLQLSPEAAAGAFTEQLFSMLWLFAICIAFLVGSLIVAKKFSMMGHSWVGTIQKRTGAVVGAAMFGAPAVAARGVFGSMGRAAANTGMGMQGSSNSLVRGIGRSMTFVGDRAQSASFDARAGAARILPPTAGMAGEAGGVGGYAAERAKKQKAHEERYDAQRKRLQQLTASEQARIDEIDREKREKIKLMEDNFARTHGRNDDGTPGRSLKETEQEVDRLTQEKNEKQSAHKRAQAARATAAEALQAKLATQRASIEQQYATAQATPGQQNQAKQLKKQLDLIDKLNGGKPIQDHEMSQIRTLAGVGGAAEVTAFQAKMQAEKDAKKAFETENRKLFTEQAKIEAHKRDKWAAEDDAKKKEKEVKKGMKTRVREFDERLERQGGGGAALEARRAALRRYRSESQ